MNPFSPGSVAHAHRNARIIHWLESLTIGEQDDLRRLFAGHLGCPLDEVPAWDASLMDDTELSWLYATCGNQIDRL